jgi:hypothetical protein
MTSAKPTDLLKVATMLRSCAVPSPRRSCTDSPTRGKRYLDWPITDPADKSLAEAIEIAAEIDTRVRNAAQRTGAEVTKPGVLVRLRQERRQVPGGSRPHGQGCRRN